MPLPYAADRSMAFERNSLCNFVWASCVCVQSPPSFRNSCEKERRCTQRRWKRWIFFLNPYSPNECTTHSHTRTPSTMSVGSNTATESVRAFPLLCFSSTIPFRCISLFYQKIRNAFAIRLKIRKRETKQKYQNNYHTLRHQLLLVLCWTLVPEIDGGKNHSI